MRINNGAERNVVPNTSAIRGRVVVTVDLERFAIPCPVYQDRDQVRLPCCADFTNSQKGAGHVEQTEDDMVHALAIFDVDSEQVLESKFREAVIADRSSRVLFADLGNIGIAVYRR